MLPKGLLAVIGAEAQVHALGANAWSVSLWSPRYHRCISMFIDGQIECRRKRASSRSIHLI